MAPLMQFYLLWGMGFWLARRWFLRRGTRDYHGAALKVMVLLTGVAMCASLACVAAGVAPRWQLVGTTVLLGLGCFACWWDVGMGVRFPFAAGVAAVIVTGLVTGNPRLVPAGVTAVLIVVLARRPTIPSSAILRVLSLVGMWSYSIYLTHTYVVYRVLKAPSLLGWSPDFTGMVVLCVTAVAGAIACGAVFYYIVERPLARLSKRVRYRQPAAASVPTPPPTLAPWR
jgi:peptidoglycan/LPS O-acetylase OafA/YrhL